MWYYYMYITPSKDLRKCPIKLATFGVLNNEYRYNYSFNVYYLLTAL